VSVATRSLCVYRVKRVSVSFSPFRLDEIIMPCHLEKCQQITPHRLVSLCRISLQRSPSHAYTHAHTHARVSRTRTSAGSASTNYRARAPPHGGPWFTAITVIGFRNLCQIFREDKDKIINNQDYHTYSRYYPAHLMKSRLNCSNPLSVRTCSAISSKTLGGIVHISAPNSKAVPTD